MATHEDAAGANEGEVYVSVESQSIAQQQHTLWIESKSQVLDEVDQLVELMTEEKATLTKKIAELEDKLESISKMGCSLEEDKKQLQSEYETAKAQLQEMQEKHSKERSGLKEALSAARKELSEARKKLESLTSDLVTEQEKCVQINSAQVVLKQKLKCLQGEHKSVTAALEIQCRENFKAHEQSKTLTAENSMLKTELESLQQKLKHSQDDVLAMRGRLTTTKKLNEQLRLKYSELDKALNEATSKSPTVIKVASRSKEELRLLTECKKKDGLIDGYIEELAAANETKLRVQNNLRRLEQKLKTEQKEKEVLQNALEEKKQEAAKEEKSLHDRLSQCVSKLQAREAKEEESISVRETLRNRLCQIEEELSASRKELATLREELKERNEKSEKERMDLEIEREKSQSLHQVNQGTIDQLRSELDERKHQHDKAMEEMNEQWESKLKEAREDYQRLVEVSTRRCTELAREVWQLKAQLQETSSEDRTATVHAPADTNHDIQ